MESALTPSNQPSESIGKQVRRAVIWRSGSQIVAQIVQWSATFLVIRILDPHDYGLFAMSQVALMLLGLLSGQGLASVVVRQPEITQRQIRQLFGMLLLINGALALAQILFAPLFAAYFRQPVIGDMLRVQALIYMVTPFVALPQALLSRSLEFSRQAWINIGASLASAATALTGAMLGWGVWTLVAAPLVLFAVRGFGLTVAAGGMGWPSFDFRGTDKFVRYGGLIALGQLFVLVWTQADVVIAGRTLGPHLIGIYSTSLFLVQIFVSKLVPPLNEVAFAAYARLQAEAGAVARAFLKLARLVTAAGMPFYFGLAATAEPLVLTVLGPHWAEAAPVVRMLALSMPFYTVYVLLAPATDALGAPANATRNSATAAVIAPIMLLFASQFGVAGLSAAWLLIFPLLLGFALWRALPVIGVSIGELVRAVAPPTLAAMAMAVVVTAVDLALPAMPPSARLAMLVASGALAYGGWLLLFVRPMIAELVDLARGRV